MDIINKNILRENFENQLNRSFSKLLRKVYLFTYQNVFIRYNPIPPGGFVSLCCSREEVKDSALPQYKPGLGRINEIQTNTAGKRIEGSNFEIIFLLESLCITM